jgi:hypothetical protein
MEAKSSSSQEGLSNLQRKVMRNTFINKSNNLRLRDEFSSKQSISDVFQASKSRESRPDDTSGLSKVLGTQGISFSQSLLQTTKELDLSHIPQTSEEAVAKLQDSLLRAEAGSIVVLPPLHLRLNSLRLCNPLTLKGSPGTVLELVNGSIVVDFSSQSKESILGRPSDRVVICELSLVFGADRRYLDSKSPVALFVVDTPNSSLEIRDCDIKSLSMEPHNTSAESSGQGTVQDVCLWVNGFASRRIARETGFCSVYVTSCNITGFYEFVKGGNMCKVQIEKCHISDCSGNAITLYNPSEALVHQSVIERCQGSAIDIRLSGDGSRPTRGSRSGSLSTSKDMNPRSIVITGNDLRTTGGYGVTIWAEHQAAVPMSLAISKNKITNCRKEGLAIRHLSLCDVNVTSNDFSVNQGSGCWIQKVYKLYSESIITISLNRAFDSHAGYGIYLYDTAGVLDGNECFRNSCKC